MLRILIAVAALYVFTSYTKADESNCSAIGKFIESRPAGFNDFRVLTGDEVGRAVAFYNSVPGDDLLFSSDSIVIIRMPSGSLRIVFAHSGLVCESIMIPQPSVRAVMEFIVGSKV